MYVEIFQTIFMMSENTSKIKQKFWLKSFQVLKYKSYPGL